MEYAGIFMDSRGICIGNSMKRVVILKNARIHADEIISAESNVDVLLPYVRVGHGPTRGHGGAKTA
jgi:hypothetical protein